MQPDTADVTGVTPRAATLTLLAGYVAAVVLINLWRIAGGDGAPMLLAPQIAVVVAAIASRRRASGPWRTIGDWLPLIALPLLYWELPWATVGSGRMFDATIQRWDAGLFGTQPAHTMAAAMPYRMVSEPLHLAYLLYYAIIYVPPAMLFRSTDRRAFHSTVFAVTVTVVASFAAFSVFPVEGPRFAWAAPPGIPDGPIRRLTLLVLEHGSARGTAFPSSHVAISLAQAIVCWRWRRSMGWSVGVTTLLLAIGAVYGGFHYAADVLVGAVVGGLTATIAWRIERAIRSSAKSPR